MTTDNNQVNNQDQDVDALNTELNVLINKAQKINQEIADINNETNQVVDAIEMEVDQSIKNIERSVSELDQIEKETEDELNKLMLQHAKDLADYSDEDEIKSED